MTDLKVLVVDDDPTIREVLTAMLDGLDLAEAPDGVQALQVAGEMRPDVVLLDIMMPGVDGYEVCRRLKGLPHPPRVIMITAKATSADEQEAREAGADDYLRKPFSPLQLLRILGVEPPS